jgi:hypothetical protein
VFCDRSVTRRALSVSSGCGMGSDASILEPGAFLV